MVEVMVCLSTDGKKYFQQQQRVDQLQAESGSPQNVKKGFCLIE